jgi:hypothetical protein
MGGEVLGYLLFRGSVVLSAVTYTTVIPAKARESGEIQYAAASQVDR